MLELYVQKYLRSGKSLEDLKEELGIKYSTYDNLVVLNYGQIDSPKTNPIVMECRALILELGSWDVVSWAFQRFFNYGEALELTEDFDFENAMALEKIDGSILQVFNYNNKWYMSTRGSIEGQGQVGLSNITFKELFVKITQQDFKSVDDFYGVLREDFTYIFELVSFENKIVKLYDEYQLYLLGIRQTFGLNNYELNYENLKDYCNDNFTDVSFIKMPEVYSFKNVNELLKLHDDMNVTDEGFVCVDYTRLNAFGCFHRIKVKNPAYVAIAHMKDSGASSITNLLILIMKHDVEEFLSYFPEFTDILENIKEKYDKYVENIEKDIILTKDQNLLELNKKDFASYAIKMTIPAMMFNIYDKKINSYQEYIEQQIEKRGAKVLAKKICEVLKLKELEINI